MIMSINPTKKITKNMPLSTTVYKALQYVVFILICSTLYQVPVLAKAAKSGTKAHHARYMSGVASYYGEGDGANGRLMANGDIFNKNDVNLAAHPSLPLGTKLLVTNLTNGRSLYVEVTDRMPYHRHRVIDLSAGAASYLGMHHKGLTRVTLTRVDEKEFERHHNYIEVSDSERTNIETNSTING